MKKFLKILGFIIGIPILLLFAFICYVSYEGDYKAYRGLKFDRNIWDEDGGALVLGGKDSVYGTNLRCKMYDDLSKNHLREGMKLHEVEDLLGEVELLTYCKKKKIKCGYYRLGTCYASSWTLSSATLRLCFNKDLEVIKFGKDDILTELCGDDWASCYKEKQCRCHVTEKMEDGGKHTHFFPCKEKIDRW